MFTWYGNPSGETVRQAMRDGEFGVTHTPAQGLYEGLGGVPSIVDNGSFGDGYIGDVEFLAWLTTLPEPQLVQFVVAPDVVGDAAATLKRSAPFLPVIRRMGFRVAFAAQNGITPAQVPWGEVNVIFLGGVPECLPCKFVRPVKEFKWTVCPRCGRLLKEWKESAAAAELVVAALEHEKDAHMGRLNGAYRGEIATAMGCVSGDGTYLAFGPDTNLPKLRKWLRRIQASQEQGALPLWEAS